MSVISPPRPTKTPCPDWCQSDHGASAPESIRHLYVTHLRNVGGVGGSWVCAVDPGDGPRQVGLNTMKNGEHTSLDLDPDEALALARIFDQVESDNAATLADALRKAAVLVTVPAAAH